MDSDSTHVKDRNVIIYLINKVNHLDITLQSQRYSIFMLYLWYSPNLFSNQYFSVSAQLHTNREECRYERIIIIHHSPVT